MRDAINLLSPQFCTGSVSWWMPAVIDGEFAVAVRRVDLDEALTETDVGREIIFLRLNGGGNYRSMPTTDTINMALACFERFRSCAVKGTVFVDDVSQGERGWKHGQPVEVEFERIKVTKVAAFDQRFVAIKHDAKFGLDHAVLTRIADAQP